MDKQGENQELKNLLEQKYSTLLNEINVDVKIYYSLSSLRNFIYFFDKINNDNDRNWIFENLSRYIDECINNDSFDREIGNQLFSKYLNKVGNYYRDYLGFTLTTSIFIITALFSVVFFTLLVFMQWQTSLMFTVPFYILTILFFQYKRRMKKAYCLFY